MTQANAPLVDSILVKIKYEFGPNWESRYRDDVPILSRLNEAVERVCAILQRRDIPIHQKRATVALTPGQAEYPLPDGYMSTIGLYTGNRQIEHIRDEELLSIRNATPLRYWAIRWPNLVVSAAPSSEQELTLLYWPVAPKLVKSDYSPWGGRLDTILARYAAALLKNADEFDITQDQLLDREMEELIMRQLVQISPQVKRGKGWLR